MVEWGTLDTFQGKVAIRQANGRQEAAISTARDVLWSNDVVGL